MPLIEFDPYDPVFLEDPYPTYARLRAERPVFFDDRWNLTFFSSYEDVSAILKDRRFGRDFHHVLTAAQVDPDLYRRIYPADYPAWTHFIRGGFIDLEPPAHTQIRRLVSNAFTRRQAEEFRPRLERLANHLLDRALMSGSIEVITEYATPIPVTMITELLGIPESDQQQLLDWSHAVVRLFDHNCTHEEGAIAERSVIDFADYLRTEADRRRRDPGEDLISALVSVEDEGRRLTEDDLVATCILVLNAGHEATVHAIGNGLAALTRHTDQLARLRSNPAIATVATEELLRFDAPLQMFERWVLEDLDWGEHRLNRGTKVGLLYGAANRDPARFSDPHRLDLGRADNPHLAFGAGTHFCVGAALATLELEVAFTTFAEKVRTARFAGDGLRHHPSLVFRGFEALPLEIG